MRTVLLLHLLCVQILLGPQTFSSIASRLAELGMRLMLTETEAAAAGAGAAGSHHATHHTHASRHPAPHQSVLPKSASSAAALWAAGRGTGLSTLAHESESGTNGKTIVSQCSAVQCGSVQCGSLQCSAVQRSAAQRCAMRTQGV